MPGCRRLSTNKLGVDGASGLIRRRRSASLDRLAVNPCGCDHVRMTFRFLLLLAAAALGSAQDPSSKAAQPGRPPLFWREDFKETPAATPIAQDHISGRNLRMALYGPGKDGMRKSHHDTPADDPYYVWDGSCAGNCAISLRENANYADLTGLAKIHWRTKQSGFRRLHLIVKLAGGAWLVSGPLESASTDWLETEWAIADLRWHRLDIATLVEGAVVEHPDLSRVDEIGWTTLMTGGGTPASSRVDWIALYGRAVPREPASQH